MKFGRHNQPVKCKVCGKLTQEVVQGAIGLEMCRKCQDEAELENEHSDGYHDTDKYPDCPLCKAAP